MDSKPAGPQWSLAHFKALYRIAANETKLTFREAWFDIEAYKWTRLLFWMGILAWLVGLICALIGAISGAAPQGIGFCLPNDEFSTDPEDYNIWSSSGFFLITIGFGNMTFGVAKFIDVAFDVVSTLHHCDLILSSLTISLGCWSWRPGTSSACFLLCLQALYHLRYGDFPHILQHIQRTIFPPEHILLGYH
jgi:hypothetical protein